MTQILASLRQPCLKVSQCVLMCLKVSQSVSMCLELFQCVSMCLNVLQCVSMCLKVYQSVNKLLNKIPLLLLCLIRIDDSLFDSRVKAKRILP
jgi:hypothetical protein